MKAMEIKSKTELIQLDIAKPEVIPETSILIRVTYAALDTAIDSVVLKPDYAASYLHDLKVKPLIVGWHYAGIVEEVGSSIVSEYKKNDSVFGHLQYAPSTKQGSFCEYILVPGTDCSKFDATKLPPDVAAASTTESMTALQALRDKAHLTKDKSVLVLGAGGGVGMMAIQLAKLLGASKVHAVCSTRDVERVKAVGTVDLVIDRSQTDIYTQHDEKYDVIFDVPCAYNASTLMRSKLNPKGAYVTTLPSLSLASGFIQSFWYGMTCGMVECKSKKEDLEKVANWLENGELKCAVDSVFPIKDMADALERQAVREKIGRVVIKVENGWE